MEVQIQNLSRPSNTPAVLPLAYLAPGQIGGPDSGVEAFGLGAREGQSIAAPLAEMGNYLTQYSSPEAEAKRKASIAQAGLAETTAGQENKAALATPGLPQAAREYNLEQVNAGRQVLPAQTGLTLAKIGSEQETLPGQTKLALAGNEASLLNAQNALNTTPSYAPTMTEDEVKRSAGAKASAIEKAKAERDIAIAGNPFLSGAATVPEGKYLSNGKLMDDTTTQESIQGPDGKVYIQRVWSHSGKPVSGRSNVLSGVNASIGAAGDRSLINAGVVPEDATPEQEQAAHNKGLADPNLNAKESMRAQRVGQQFQTNLNRNYLPKFQLIQGFDSVASKAMDPATASGVPDVDLIDTAGRLYRGGAMTEVQYNAIKRASGLDDQIWNLPQSIGSGKVLTPAARKDLIDTVRKFESELTQSYERDWEAAATRLPANADPETYLGPKEYAASMKEGSTEEVPTLSPEQAQKLPAGAQFKGTDGILRTKH